MNDLDERDPVVRDALVEMVADVDPKPDWQAGVWSKLARGTDKRSLLRRIRGWQIAAAAMMVLIAGLSMWAFEKSKQNEQIEAAAKKKLQQFEDSVSRYQREIDELITKKDEETARIVNAQDQEARAAAIVRQKSLDKALAAKRSQLAKVKKAARMRDDIARERRIRVKVKCDPVDPLCGL